MFQPYKLLIEYVFCVYSDLKCLFYNNLFRLYQEDNGQAEADSTGTAQKEHIKLKVISQVRLDIYHFISNIVVYSRTF